MAVVVGAKDADRTAALFGRLGVKAHVIGEVVRGVRGVEIVT
jgi:phosphoribosylaminoimidazole (AIR) synthetase